MYYYEINKNNEIEYFTDQKKKHKISEEKAIALTNKRLAGYAIVYDCINCKPIASMKPTPLSFWTGSEWLTDVDKERHIKIVLELKVIYQWIARNESKYTDEFNKRLKKVFASLCNDINKLVTPDEFKNFNTKKVFFDALRTSISP